MSKKDIICWWSGGVTSAVACKLAANIYGLDNCRFIMIDTRNEDDDTYRFKKDCEAWYGKEITTIDGFCDNYETIQDVWRHYKSLNVARGAICSSELKRETRITWQKDNEYRFQVFGFEHSTREFKRSLSMRLNYEASKPIFPLQMFGFDKEDCLNILEVEGIKVPNAYRMGFHNNNCLKTGCIQGGHGYWQKMKREQPEKYYAMAEMEHELTEMKGEPVTMLKDQSNAAKARMKDLPKSHLVFLEPHKDFPDNKSLKDMRETTVQPLVDCNGYCGLDDLT